MLHLNHSGGQSVSEMMIQSFRYDGEGQMYRFEIRNPGLEMVKSQVIAKIVLGYL